MGQFCIECCDIHFGIITHAPVVQIGGADRGPEIVDDCDFRMHIDGSVVFFAFYFFLHSSNLSLFFQSPAPDCWWNQVYWNRYWKKTILPKQDEHTTAGESLQARSKHTFLSPSRGARGKTANLPCTRQGLPELCLMRK